ncbi:MAG: hypothetical protein HQK51_21260 [Oligoflexia bacterium]|nr:hypothetical protein [Oligoflexia bacterium]
MIKYIIPFALMFSLVSCSSMKQREVVEVKVPVVQPWPEPPKIERPMLEVNSISDEDIKNKNYDKIIKSLQITNQQLIDYSETLEKYLDAYRKKEVATGSN